MRLSLHLVSVLAVCFDGAFADFLTPTYPAPADLTSDDSLIPVSWRNFTDTLNVHLNETEDSALLSGLENVTFSVGMFSIHDRDDAASLQYHYTSSEIRNAELGTREVDADSIYRIASVTKLATVYAGMIELTEEDWNRPITDVLPQLAEIARDANKDDNVYTIQWDKITLWALASQLAGIPSLGWPAGDRLLVYAAEAAAGLESAVDPVIDNGFPPLDLSVLGPCNNFSGPVCSDDDFLESFRNQAPSFLPWTSPGYTNAGFMLLGLAYSNITGKPMHDIYRDSIFSPLGMDSSTSIVPTGAELARAVVAGDPAANFAIEGGFTIPSGGLFSTLNDLAKFGVGILNSTLMPAEKTRKWMKPVTHTSSFSYSIGAPWEIIRYVHPSTGKVTDFYTKLGDSGYYGAITALIPDYNAGFSLLAACSNATTRTTAMSTLR